MKQHLNELLAKHTGQTLEQIQNDTDRDNFMTSIEASEYGLIDSVLNNRRELDKENVK